MKIGDVYYIEEKGKYHFFQFIGKDKAYLFGHIVRIFNATISDIKSFKFDEIYNSGIKMYGSTLIPIGVDQGIYVYLLNHKIERGFQAPEFISTPDSRKYKEKSNEWVYWKFGTGQLAKIGELDGKYKNMQKISILLPDAFVEYVISGEISARWPD